MDPADSQPHKARRAPTTMLGAIEMICPDDADIRAGVLWRLQEPGRQVDANLVHLVPGDRIDWHTERQRDVLLVVLSGTGTVHSDDGHLPLIGGTVLWLPRNTRRSLTAGSDGLTYVTAHQRRGGLQIQHRPTAQG